LAFRQNMKSVLLGFLNALYERDTALHLRDADYSTLGDLDPGHYHMFATSRGKKHPFITTTAQLDALIPRHVYTKHYEFDVLAHVADRTDNTVGDNAEDLNEELPDLIARMDKVFTTKEKEEDLMGGPRSDNEEPVADEDNMEIDQVMVESTFVSGGKAKPYDADYIVRKKRD
jgi:hypothetical protein